MHWLYPSKSVHNRVQILAWHRNCLNLGVPIKPHFRERGNGKRWVFLGKTAELSQMWVDVVASRNFLALHIELDAAYNAYNQADRVTHESIPFLVEIWERLLLSFIQPPSGESFLKLLSCRDRIARKMTSPFALQSILSG